MKIRVDDINKRASDSATMSDAEVSKILAEKQRILKGVINLSALGASTGVELAKIDKTFDKKKEDIEAKGVVEDFNMSALEWADNFNKLPTAEKGEAVKELDGITEKAIQQLKDKYPILAKQIALKGMKQKLAAQQYVISAADKEADADFEANIKRRRNEALTKDMSQLDILRQANEDAMEAFTDDKDGAKRTEFARKQAQLVTDASLRRLENNSQFNELASRVKDKSVTEHASPSVLQSALTATEPKSVKAAYTKQLKAYAKLPVTMGNTRHIVSNLLAQGKPEEASIVAEAVNAAARQATKTGIQKTFFTNALSKVQDPEIKRILGDYFKNVSGQNRADQLVGLIGTQAYDQLSPRLQTDAGLPTALAEKVTAAIQSSDNQADTIASIKDMWVQQLGPIDGAKRAQQYVDYVNKTKTREDDVLGLIVGLSMLPVNVPGEIPLDKFKDKKSITTVLNAARNKVSGSDILNKNPGPYAKLLGFQLLKRIGDNNDDITELQLTEEHTEWLQSRVEELENIVQKQPKVSINGSEMPISQELADQVDYENNSRKAAEALNGLINLDNVDERTAAIANWARNAGAKPEVDGRGRVFIEGPDGVIHHLRLGNGSYVQLNASEVATKGKQAVYEAFSLAPRKVKGVYPYTIPELAKDPIEARRIAIATPLLKAMDRKDRLEEFAAETGLKKEDARNYYMMSSIARFLLESNGGMNTKNTIVPDAEGIGQMRPIFMRENLGREGDPNNPEDVAEAMHNFTVKAVKKMKSCAYGEEVDGAAFMAYIAKRYSSETFGGCASVGKAIKREFGGRDYTKEFSQWEAQAVNLMMQKFAGTEAEGELRGNKYFQENPEKFAAMMEMVNDRSERMKRVAHIYGIDLREFKRLLGTKFFKGTIDNMKQLRIK